MPGGPRRKKKAGVVPARGETELFDVRRRLLSPPTGVTASLPKRLSALEALFGRRTTTDGSSALNLSSCGLRARRSCRDSGQG